VKVSAHDTTDANGRSVAALLAQRVKQLRLSKGWGPDELATRAKISRTALYQIENGRTEQPRAGTIRRLARALCVDPNALVSPRPSTLLGPFGVDGSARDLATALEPGAESDDAANAGATATPEESDLYRNYRLELKFRRLLASPMRDAVSRIIEEAYRLLPPEEPTSVR
jgi:transcriptional regulator with XRE-family HTH domain